MTAIPRYPIPTSPSPHDSLCNVRAYNVVICTCCSRPVVPTFPCIQGRAHTRVCCRARPPCTGNTCDPRVSQSSARKPN